MLAAERRASTRESGLPSQKRRYLREPIQDPNATAIEVPEEDALPLLRSGKILGGYRLPWGSNYTFLVAVAGGDGEYLRAIYKPMDGERPLYDFPHGSLYKREYAAFLLSRGLGWPNVPLTLIREGPYGIGMMQLYISCDPEITYFDLVEDRAEEMRSIAAFDLLANNADRKAGHCLLGPDDRVWSVDHGLTFHPMLKLRSVMLEFWGHPIPQPLIADLEALLLRLESADGLARELGEVLTPPETRALTGRLRAMLEDRALPDLDPFRNVPWPWV
jgi:uncharacterized repeat protein (TIGR03843 family)